ncbi:MAG TPA: Na+/H+ antiporter NhaC family protein, partial [Candidatus Spyradenecus faecavium]|nr:Na+/H+ antiporter NhaC family protein [Candidatus Spyradenecus faecavium]
MTANSVQTQPRLSGLLPVAILLALFLGVGIPLHGRVALPAIVPFLAALGVAFLQCRHRPFPERLNVVARAMGQTDVMVMCLVFLLAGAFAGAAEAAGCVTSTVNFGLSVLPAWATVAGLFVIASFASTAMGTSVGTITAIAPIAVGIAEATGMGAPLCLGAVVCGAMFGDNLSIISDTTIAATRTQGCDMRAKFRENLRLVLPAALLTVALFVAVAPGGGVPAGAHPFSVPLLLPYLAVLVTALCGMNVVLVLALGTLLSLGVGIGMGELPAAEAFRAVG